VRREPAGEGGEEDLDAEERNLSSLYWGLSATSERGAGGPIDARRFIDNPDLEDDEEEGGDPCCDPDCSCDSEDRAIDEEESSPDEDKDEA
jgi:hypothetical protein